MTRSHKIIGFLFVAMLGLYGCARGSSAGSANDRAALEAKVQRLEEDFRAAAATRDSFRQQLLAAEEKQTQTQKSLDQMHQERDAARAELKARTGERDNLQTQYETFRKSIKDLLGQAEAALNPAPASPSASPSAVAGTGSAPSTPADATNIRN